MSKPFSSTAQRPRWGGVEAILIGVFGTFSIHIIVAVVLGGLYSPSLLRSMAIRLLAGLASVGLCFVVARKYRQSWPALGLAKSDRGMWKGIAVAAVTYALVSRAIFLILAALAPQLDLDQIQNLNVTHTGGLLSLLGIYLTLVLMPALFEEIIYRGFVFGGLRSQISFWPAALLSSFLFGLAHYQFNVGLDTFCLGLALCWLYERYRSLMPAILLHLIKNSVPFLVRFVL
jgi:membrane protease YdiL (CAAX protease family)